MLEILIYSCSQSEEISPYFIKNEKKKIQTTTSFNFPKLPKSR